MNNKKLIITAIGAAQPWQIGFQTTASPLFERIVDLHNDILCVLVGIVCGVFFACAHICLGYSLPRRDSLANLDFFRDVFYLKRARAYTRNRLEILTKKLVRVLIRGRRKKLVRRFLKRNDRKSIRSKVVGRRLRYAALLLRRLKRDLWTHCARRGNILSQRAVYDIIRPIARRIRWNILLGHPAGRAYLLVRRRAAKRVQRVLRAARRQSIKSFMETVRRDLYLLPTGTYFRQIPHSAPALETLWTVIPMIILAAIAMPTFSLIYMLDEFHEPALTVKAIGNQWYWSYEYAEGRGLWANAVFDSYMLPEDELQPGDLRLLTVDKELILPVATEVRLLVTSMDVIHSWAVPALGIKVDAVPGRLNEVALYINYMGVYYGQCSELCGVNHAFMPIMIRAISPLYFTSFK